MRSIHAPKGFSPLGILVFVLFLHTVRSTILYGYAVCFILDCFTKLGGILLELAIFGMIIGIANIIPGVSGGTMAVILGVYDKLIASVSNIRTKFWESIKYLAPIGVGAVVGIVLFASIIEYTLEHFSMATNMVFVGLIVGSIPMIYKKATAKKVDIASILAFVVCFGFMLFMKLVTPEEDANSVITTLTVASFVQVFISSAISAGAMIIPGISGSFVMLLLGLYTTVLATISEISTVLGIFIDTLKGEPFALDALLSSGIWLLIPIGLGCLVGILGCAKIIEKLFEKASCPTYFGILGFMLGSLLIIFPPIVIGVEFFVSVVLLVAAAATAYLFSKK